MKPDRLAKLVKMSAQAPLMPLAVPGPQLAGKTSPGGYVARLSVSLPPSEADVAGELARKVAMATGDKPTQSELMRAGLMLLAGLSLADLQATLARVPKVR